MRKRFTYASRTTRGRVRPDIRIDIFRRDDFTCQYCRSRCDATHLTIDHLVPLALGGLDEVTNYVTACRPCNERKAAQPLASFAETLSLPVAELPVHGDPIIDNAALPLQIRMVRKRVFDQIRAGELAARGRSAQQKIEKEYRRAFWQTNPGKRLEAEAPSLPGHVRIMLPEIRFIAKTPREYLLLIELAKSANTRNLIGDVLTPESDVEGRLRSVLAKSTDEALTKRIAQARTRLERACRHHRV